MGKMSSWLRIRRVALGSRTGSLGTWEFTGRVACPMPVSFASEAFQFGFDLGKVLSALFDDQIGPDDFTFAFWLTFTLSFGSSGTC